MILSQELAYLRVLFFICHAVRVLQTAQRRLCPDYEAWDALMTEARTKEDYAACQMLDLDPVFTEARTNWKWAFWMHRRYQTYLLTIHATNLVTLGFVTQDQIEEARRTHYPQHERVNALAATVLGKIEPRILELEAAA